MNKPAFDPMIRVAALAAAFAVSACATAKPAPKPAPSNPAPQAARSAATNAVATSPAAAPAAAATVSMPTGTLTRVGGTVVAIDAAARTLTIKDYGGRTRSLRVADGAKLTKGGDESAVQLGDIAAGDRVRLKIGGDVAASVHVMVKPAS